jgi:hypothetical protein
MILYFIPSDSKATAPDHCKKESDVHGGPGGKIGRIYAVGEGPVGYYPDTQKWEKVSNDETDTYWLGVDRDDFSPSDIERGELIDGHLVTLEDGNKWLIPVARVFPIGTRLPEALILGPGGELVSEVLPRFAQFSKDADRAYDALTGEGELSIADAWEIAVKALSLNYKLDRQEVSLLHLLTTTNIMEILKAIVDLPAILEMSKKKAEESSSIDNGNVA